MKHEADTQSLAQEVAMEVPGDVHTCDVLWPWWVMSHTERGLGSEVWVIDHGWVHP